MLAAYYARVTNHLLYLQKERRDLNWRTFSGLGLSDAQYGERWDCRGQALNKGSKALSFHCCDPLCGKEHHPRLWESKGKGGVVSHDCFREQFAVSELCESLDKVPVPLRPTRQALPLRPLDNHWDIPGSHHSFEALFDETAQLLAMLHMEATERLEKHGVQPHTLYGQDFMCNLENTLFALWDADLKPHGVYVYKNIVCQLRDFAEGLVKEGMKKLQDEADKAGKPKFGGTDFVAQVVAIAKMASSNYTPPVPGAAALPAFQEPCWVVQKFASASGCHNSVGKIHFELADNLGNNFIIVCRAIVHACALYDQFSLQWWSRGSKGHVLPPLDVSKLQDKFGTYLSALRTRLQTTVHGIPRIWERCQAVDKAVPMCIVLPEELCTLRKWCLQLHNGAQEMLRTRPSLSETVLNLVDELHHFVQAAQALIQEYAGEDRVGQVVRAVFSSKKLLDDLHDLSVKKGKPLAEKWEQPGIAESMSKEWFSLKDDVKTTTERAGGQPLAAEVEGEVLRNYHITTEGHILPNASGEASGMKGHGGYPTVEEMIEDDFHRWDPIPSTPDPDFNEAILKAALERAVQEGSSLLGPRLEHFIAASLRPGPQSKIRHLDMRVLWFRIQDDSKPLSIKPPDYVSWEIFYYAFPREVPTIDKATKKQVLLYILNSASWPQVQASIMCTAQGLTSLNLVNDGKFDDKLVLKAEDVDLSFPQEKNLLEALKSCIERSTR